MMMTKIIVGMTTVIIIALENVKLLCSMLIIVASEDEKWISSMMTSWIGRPAHYDIVGSNQPPHPP